jgi:hypothetical protein
MTKISILYCVSPSSSNLIARHSYCVYSVAMPLLPMLRRPRGGPKCTKISLKSGSMTDILF